MHHFCFCELFFAKYRSTVIWILFLLYFSLNVFLQSSKISCMQLINKNVPAKRDKMFTLEKNVPPKKDSEFMKVGSLLGRMIHFINIIWFCNRTLLSGVISLSQGHHFGRMFFPHINTLTGCVWSSYVSILMLLLYRWLKSINASVLILEAIDST